MRPSFLIIGAMKAGTTTVYEDLSGIKGLYLLPEKEPNDLIHPITETQSGFEDYCAKFHRAPAGAICGEASTAYAKLPTYCGVAERAVRLLGTSLKIIYLTREPIARIISQYNHLSTLGRETRPINIAVLEDETYVAYSQYQRQLAPWRAVLEDRQILVIRFEDYITDRHAELARICNFLGVSPPQTVEATHRNASRGRRAAHPGTIWHDLVTSQFYLYRVKPLLPSRLRDTVKRLILPKAIVRDVQLSDATRAELQRRLSDGA